MQKESLLEKNVAKEDWASFIPGFLNRGPQVPLGATERFSGGQGQWLLPNSFCGDSG